MAAQSDIVLGRSSVVAPAAPVLLPRRVPLWRRLLAWLFLLLFCLAAPLALLAGWGRWAVSDADRYAATVRTAAADPGLQAALSTAVAARLGDPPTTGFAPTRSDRVALAAVQTDPPAPTATAIPPERAVRRASSAASPTSRPAGTPATTTTVPTAPAPTSAPEPTTAPPRAQSATTPVPVLTRRPATPAAAATPLAPATTADGPTASGAEDYFRSPEFAGAWEETNRLAYTALREEGPARPLALDLSPVLPGLAAALGVPSAAAAAGFRLELLDAAAGERLRTALDRLDWLSIVLPAVALLLLVGTLWAAPGKLRWLRRLGFGLALSMVVLLLTLLLGAPVATGRVGDPLAAEVVRALLDALLWWPVLLAAAVLAVGLGLAILAGLTSWLVAGRRARA